MPELARGGRIRDPVYGYVAFTGLERAIIDHPTARRLRYVAQSGLAQLVFPEVRTSRFSHSLGAMHLTSQFFTAALRNAESDTRERIEGLIDELIRSAAGMGLPDETPELTRVLTRQGLQSGAAVSDQARTNAVLLEQALRLAALFHDLGHLPFSHDFEYALDELFWSEGDTASERFPTLAERGELATHERIGYSLAGILLRELFGEIVDQPQGRAVEVAFVLAREILAAIGPPDLDSEVGPESELEGLRQWLHTLVAGEIDVDRCDYLLRDTRYYGFEFVSFDLPRLVDNLTVVPGQANEHVLVSAVLPQGQAALESLLLARYRMYQWGIRHHKIAQAAAALRRVIRDLLRPGVGGDGELGRFLEDIEAIAAAEHGDVFLRDHGDVFDRFAGYDDVWWIRLMREAAQGSDDPWLNLVCYRRPGPVSLWKRLLDFPGDASLKEFNERLPRGAEAEARARWAEAARGLEERGALVLRHGFKPWERQQPGGADAPSVLSVFHRERGLVPLSEVSPVVKTLWETWMNDIQVHAFAAEPGLIEPAEVTAALSEAAEAEDEAPQDKDHSTPEAESG